jgi:putative heme-binding domain-containing protein
MRVFFRLLCAAALVALAAAAVLAQGAAQDHGQYDRADIEAGARIFGQQCALCHGANGDLVDGVDLLRGRFRTALTDEGLARVIATGRPAAGMPGFPTMLARDVTSVIAYIRAGYNAIGTPVKIGDATRGEALFTGAGACATCHRVNGRGPRTASDLSDIGAVRTPAALQRVLVDPNAMLLPANRSVRAVTRDGRAIRGRRLNEDTFTIQIIDDQERLVSLTKTDLRSLEIVPTSAMPSSAKTLSEDQIADLVAYLLTLKSL